MIKTIIFDLGGVLFTNGSKKFIRVLSKRYKFSHLRVDDVINGEIGTQYRKGKISRDAFWQKFLEELQIHADLNKLEEEWIDGYELIEGTRDIVFELTKKYKVYYLSDNIRERVEKINSKYSFLKWFEGGIFSHEVGVRKPHPKIYKMVIEKVEAKPEEVIFIDDKKSSLLPAQELGMKTILFQNPEQLKKELIQLKIL